MTNTITILRVAAAIAASLLLAGCATPAGTSSSVTVVYELDGAERTVTLRPDVSCSDNAVSGLSIGDGGPAGQFSFIGPSFDGALGPGVGGINDGPGLLRFETDGIELDRDTEGVIDVAETEVTAYLFADRTESGPEYDAEDGERVDGILAAHLVCSED